MEAFPDYFALPDKLEGDDESAPRQVAAPPGYMRELLDGIDAQLRRLSPLRARVAQIEELDLESKIRTGPARASWRSWFAMRQVTIGSWTGPSIG